MVKSKRRGVSMVKPDTVLGEKRPVDKKITTGQHSSEDERIKRARMVQEARNELVMVDRLANKDTRTSFTQVMSDSLQKQCADMLKNTKTTPQNYKSLQHRATETCNIPMFLRVDIFELYRAPRRDEKVCNNALSQNCIGTQLGVVGPLVATLKDKPLKINSGDVGCCIACRIAATQQAALGNMLCGQIINVRPCQLTMFEDAVRVMVSSGPNNECEFAPNTTWNAPYTFNQQSKEGTHYGSVHHTPLLLNNLDVSPDKTRYIPHGFEFVDGGLQLKSDKNVPNITPGFLQ